MWMGCGSSSELREEEDDFFQPVQAVEQPAVPQAKPLDATISPTDSLLQKIKVQEQRISELAKQPKNLEPKKTEPRRETLRVTAPPVEKEPALTPKAEPPPTMTYDQALQIYHKRNYDQAIKEFQGLLESGIRQDLADNCDFWIGMSYFSLKRLKDAINSFEKVLGYANSNKAEESYFMLGQSYEQLKDNEKAKLMFETLIKKFPRGALTQAARRKLGTF